MSYRVRFRAGVPPKQRQESFPDPESAYAFARSCDQLGPDHALRVKNARQSSGDVIPTLRQFTAQYLDPASGLLTGVQEGTRRGYEYVAEGSWLILLGDYPVDAIFKEHVGQWLAWQEKQPSRRRGAKPETVVAAKTVRNYHNLLSQVLAAAVDKGLRKDNPAFKTRLSPGHAKEAVFLSPDEFSTILYFIPPHYEGLFLFLAGSGCRWGEATALTWGDVTPATEPRPSAPQGSPDTVRIDKAWKKSATSTPVLGTPKTKKGRRTVSIPPDVMAALGKRGAPNELVFKGELSGNRLWYGHVRQRVWERAVTNAMNPDLCDMAGLEVLTRHPTIHDLRHSHASWLIANGKPLPYIQARLGHESINTTVGVYGHLVPAANQDMADSVGLILSGVRHLKPALELT